MMRSLSNLTKGKTVGLEPVAMILCLASMVCFFFAFLIFVCVVLSFVVVVVCFVFVKHLKTPFGTTLV